MRANLVVSRERNGIGTVRFGMANEFFKVILKVDDRIVDEQQTGDAV